MKFIVEIQCDNAAFEPHVGVEVCRILAQASNNVQFRKVMAGLRAPLFDSNGNKVGSYRYIKQRGDDETTNRR